MELTLSQTSKAPCGDFLKPLWGLWKMDWHYSARVKMTGAEVPHRSSNGRRSVHSKRKRLRLGLAGSPGTGILENARSYLMAP